MNHISILRLYFNCPWKWDDFLSKFLHDIVSNMEKRRPIWSETTLSVFSLLLNYGGPTTAELISKNFGGP